MSAFLQQLKWQFIILHRNNLIIMSIVITFMYALIFYIIRDLGHVDKVLTLMIYNDPAVIGLFFIGLSFIIDKNQEILPALFVTPVNLHMFLITRVLALSIIGWLCSLGMGVSAIGLSFNLLHFSVGVFSICVLFSLIGIYLVSYTSEFLLFMLRSIPILLVLSLPMLNYFEVTNVGLFYSFPVQGCLNLVINSYRDIPVTSELIYGYVSILLWIPVLYFFVFRTFKSKLVNA